MIEATPHWLLVLLATIGLVDLCWHGCVLFFSRRKNRKSWHRIDVA
jgi:hypothetical protein